MDEDGVLEVESLLRETLGALFQRALGQEWQQGLSRRVQAGLVEAHRRARRSRDGVPDNPWLASGLNEIGSVAEHFLRRLREDGADFSDTDPDRRLGQGLKDLGWDSADLCSADIKRILRSRHDKAHPDVVAPLSAAMSEEIAAIAKRLHLGCEKVRRDLFEVDEEWFPYIERVTCPGVDDWGYQRGARRPRVALLNEGDSIEFIVRALNTDGSDARLRFGLFVQDDGGAFVTIVDDDPGGRLQCAASPPGRNVTFRVSVRDLAGGHDESGWDDHVTFVAKIRPSR